VRFQEKENSTIIGLNYISKPWNSLGRVRREREKEKDDREIEKENAVGISFASFSLDSRNMFR